MFTQDLGWVRLFLFSLPVRGCFSLTFEPVSSVSDVFLTALFASSLKQKEQSLS
jgi:hypothetical protein